MPLLSRAEHEIVARRAPRRLLGDLDVGHAVLGEEALLLGDHQRRGVDQRDVAEDRLLHLGTGGLREGAAGKLRLHGAEQRGGAGACAFRKLRRLILRRSPLSLSLVVIVSVVLSGLVSLATPGTRFPQSPANKKSRSLKPARRPPQDSGVACRPVVGPSQAAPIQASCQIDFVDSSSCQLRIQMNSSRFRGDCAEVPAIRSGPRRCTPLGRTLPNNCAVQNNRQWPTFSVAISADLPRREMAGDVVRDRRPVR